MSLSLDEILLPKTEQELVQGLLDGHRKNGVPVSSWLTLRNLGHGLLLGALNFGNILFYVRAHQALPHSPATIFAGMNIGVVCLGALVGVLVFGEKTSGWNRMGLALAVLAIALIARGA